MNASIFAVGGILNQIQGDREVVIAYASRSLRQSQRRYCTTRREMLDAVTMCNRFHSYLRGAQFALHTDHWPLPYLQKFRNSDGMLARWYMLLGGSRSPANTDLGIRRSREDMTVPREG